MAGSTPYDQLTGTLKIYIATYGTAEPDVTTTPPAAWVELGCTDGEQTEDHGVSDLTKFYDNCHIGPVKAVLTQQDPIFTFTLVSLTLEHLARIFGRTTGSVTTPTATTKKLPIKRGFVPSEWAFLAKADTDSPYALAAGQLYLPRGVFDGGFEVVRSKDGRAGVEVAFHVLEDDAQAEVDRLGWKTAATS